MGLSAILGLHSRTVYFLTIILRMRVRYSESVQGILGWLFVVKSPPLWF